MENNEEEFKPDIPFSEEEAKAIAGDNGLWKRLQRDYKEGRTHLTDEDLARFMHELRVTRKTKEL